MYNLVCAACICVATHTQQLCLVCSAINLQTCDCTTALATHSDTSWLAVIIILRLHVPSCSCSFGLWDCVAAALVPPAALPLLGGLGCRWHKVTAHPWLTHTHTLLPPPPPTTNIYIFLFLNTWLYISKIAQSKIRGIYTSITYTSHTNIQTTDNRLGSPLTRTWWPHLSIIGCKKTLICEGFLILVLGIRFSPSLLPTEKRTNQPSRVQHSPPNILQTINETTTSVDSILLYYKRSTRLLHPWPSVDSTSLRRFKKCINSKWCWFSKQWIQLFSITQTKKHNPSIKKRRQGQRQHASITIPDLCEGRYLLMW